MEKRNFYVFQDWVAKKIADEGHSYITREDLKNKTRMVYVFENKKEVRDIFDRVMGSK